VVKLVISPLFNPDESKSCLPIIDRDIADCNWPD